MALPSMALSLLHLTRVAYASCPFHTDRNQYRRYVVPSHCFANAIVSG
jgi:hypothetical protein